MCESIVVVGAALSADVDAPTERVHSAPGARRGQSPEQSPNRPCQKARTACEPTETFQSSEATEKSAEFPPPPLLRARPRLRYLAARKFYHGLPALRPQSADSESL